MSEERTTGSYSRTLAAGERYKIAQPNKDRAYLLIKNGTGTGTVAFNQDADASSLPLAAGESVAFQNPESCTWSYVSVFAVTATTFSSVEVTRVIHE